jgi:PKD repeat protein
MSARREWLLLLTTILLFAPGCAQVLELTVQPRAVLTANPVSIQEGEMVGFDARDSDAVEGVISEFRWNFGDGSTQTTISGYTSHLYEDNGIFIVELVVMNDQGGEDSTTVTVKVNGAPLLNLSIPDEVRAGDIALLDASDSTDPEGVPLAYVWDLDTNTDSDGDGNAANDVDATAQKVYLDTNQSTTISGLLTIDDGQGGITSEPFIIDVLTRKYQVTWQTKELTWEWNDYLEQGEVWQSSMFPGDGTRIMSYHALLELDNDLPPADNFTLELKMIDDGYSKSNATEPGNITQNDPIKAELSDDDINPAGVSEEYEADSEQELLERLLGMNDADAGQGEWICYVVADQTEPDPAIPIPGTDLDTGNNWTLSLTVTVQIPVLKEIAYDQS